MIDTNPLVAIQSTNCHHCWQSKIHPIHSSLLLILSLSCFSQSLIGLSQQQAAHHGHFTGSHGHEGGRGGGGGGHNRHHHMMQEPPAAPKVDPYQNIKILIPNLPPTHYPYWLKNHPRATKVFEDLCTQAGPGIADIRDLGQFHLLHANLSFEQPRYLHDLEYGKSVLSLICSKIRDVSKSCWGYENNCQEIYLMPECHGTSHGQAKDEQDQKIKWFSQADFGYILDRRKELSKYCAPDKKANPNDVSLLDCTKHFTTCRGNNLYVQFNTSNLVQRSLGLSSVTGGSGVSELGGWGCDLQTLRIKEESGRAGRHQSWYSELAGYKLVDALRPQESHDLVVDKQVFFVKVDTSSQNLDDFLATLINLYATIHLNNRFSDDTQIMLWGDKMPRPKSQDQLWYAFSRNPPMSIGQFDKRRVLFKKFIFAMPPKMVDGLHTDKQLIDGCAKSGLYNAFQKHVIHRLNTPQLYDLDFHKKYKGRLLRVAIMSRNSSEFREIINEGQLEQAIKAHSKGTFVQIIKYNPMDFGHVLFSVLNSDIVIGVHGTGLAYSLFLPDWAALIELYDCKKNRYHNLARLRGINYYKPSEEQLAASSFVKKIPVPEDSSLWQRYNRSQLVDIDEFNNYEVNVDEFMKMYLLASEKVLKSRDEHFRKLDAQQKEMFAAPTAKAAATAPASVAPSKESEQTSSTESPTTTSTSATTATTTTTTTTTMTTTTTTTAAPPTKSSEAPKAQSKIRTEPHLASVINAKGQVKPSNTHTEL